MAYLKKGRQPRSSDLDPLPQEERQKYCYCKEPGQTHCGATPCSCGKPGHLRGLLCGTFVYCDDCFAKACDELSRDMDSSGFDDFNQDDNTPMTEFIKLTQWRDDRVRDSADLSVKVPGTALIINVATIAIVEPARRKNSLKEWNDLTRICTSIPGTHGNKICYLVEESIEEVEAKLFS